MSRQRRERREMETEEYREARSHPPHMLQMMAELVASFSREDEAYSVKNLIDKLKNAIRINVYERLMKSIEALKLCYSHVEFTMHIPYSEDQIEYSTQSCLLCRSSGVTKNVPNEYCNAPCKQQLHAIK
ncbi:unnamed protein product, partial [Brenthis ino]